MARDGKMIVWQGIWMSSAIMLPLGIFVTYKAMGDSAVFNTDAYTAFFNKLRGRRPKRSLSLKEVVITEVEQEKAISMIDSLEKTADVSQDTTNRLNTLIDYLSNTRDIRMIRLLNRLPFEVTKRTLPQVKETLALMKGLTDGTITEIPGDNSSES